MGNKFIEKDGFTLLEILVALSILSLVCLALSTSGSSAVDNAIYLKERTLAQWVAMNKAAELELADKWVAVGVSDGEIEMANRKWSWTVIGHDTPNEDMRRAVIEVRPEVFEGDAVSPLSVFTIFLARP